MVAYFPLTAPYRAAWRVAGWWPLSDHVTAVIYYAKQLRAPVRHRGFCYFGRQQRQRALAQPVSKQNGQYCGVYGLRRKRLTFAMRVGRCEH